MTSRYFALLAALGGCAAWTGLAAGCGSSSGGSSGAPDSGGELDGSGSDGAPGSTPDGSLDGSGMDGAPGADASGGHDGSSGQDGATPQDGSAGEDGATADGGDAGGGSMGNLGASCATDADCGGQGLTCDLPTANDPVFGGGPVNGYCTKTCATDSDCGSAGACLLGPTNTHGTCVLTCTVGPALTNLNDPISDTTKCLARPEVACTALSASVTACLPVCGEDGQCPSGMHCDPRSSVCVATPNTGAANGQPCTFNDAGVSNCAGVCVNLVGGDGGTVAICSQDCVLGVAPAVAGTPTGWTDCNGITKGLCVYSPSGAGAGDLGFCTNACSRQDDCDNPNFFCFAITNLTGTSGISNGWCFGGTPCPNGASDCSALPQATCVQTVYGPECLSTQFPLGSAGLDAGADQ